MNYYEYINSPEWFEKTEKVRERNDGYCEVCCMRYGEHVHHRTYERLYNEKDEDLLHVCNFCHAMIHRLSEYPIWESKLPFLRILQEEVKDV